MAWLLSTSEPRRRRARDTRRIIYLVCLTRVRFAIDLLSSFPLAAFDGGPDAADPWQHLILRLPKLLRLFSLSKLLGRLRTSRRMQRMLRGFDPSSILMVQVHEPPE